MAEMRVYTGPLAELYPKLLREATKRSARAKYSMREFVWELLPGGACVGVRIRGDLDFRKEIRIAREEGLTEAARPKWDAEVRTFARHFGIELLDGQTPATSYQGEFVRQPPDPEDEGRTAVRLMELRLGEIRRGIARCGACGGETRWEPAYGVLGQRCPRCTESRAPVKAGARR